MVLVVFNLLSAAVLGTRLFVLVANLNAWSVTNPSSLLYVASLVGVDPMEDKKVNSSATRIVQHGGSVDESIPFFFVFFVRIFFEYEFLNFLSFPFSLFSDVFIF